jgi:enoyl-CoA hydratase/carnithine racemase
MSELAIHTSGDTLHVELARPAKRNALTAEMYTAMADALAEAERNASLRSVLFSAQGPGFCAGNDLADFIKRPPTEPDPPVFRFIRGLATATKILIAAVQGKAIGIGTTMLLHCDFVIAEPDAAFQMPFVDLALVPEAGSSLLIPNLLGPRRAAELLLLGERIDAEQAVQLGLVSRIVPAGQALSEARGIAARLSTKPAGALAATKRLMKSGTPGLLDQINAENHIFAERLQTAEFRQKVDAFFATRA